MTMSSLGNTKYEWEILRCVTNDKGLMESANMSGRSFAGAQDDNAFEGIRGEEVAIRKFMFLKR